MRSAPPARPSWPLGARAAVEGVVAGLVVQAALAAALEVAGVASVAEGGSAARTTTWAASLATYVGVAARRLARGGTPWRAALLAPALVAVAPAALIGGLAADAAWAESDAARLAPPVVWLVLSPLACVAATRARPAG